MTIVDDLCIYSHLSALLLFIIAILYWDALCASVTVMESRTSMAFLVNDEKVFHFLDSWTPGEIRFVINYTTLSQSSEVFGIPTGPRFLLVCVCWNQSSSGNSFEEKEYPINRNVRQ